MDWSDITRAELQNAAGVWVDITDRVRFAREDYRAFTGRQNETDAIGAGSLVLGLDNADGLFTPGVATAALAITLGMPIRAFDVIGYRRFDVFSGALEMPDATEQLEGVDNIITVTAVDEKQLLDNGRTFVSTLAEYIMSATPTTLRNYWPLTETAAPFHDLIGSGADFTPELQTTSLLDANTAAPTYTPAGGSSAAGDDARGVLFTPSQSLTGGFGFPTLASGWALRAQSGAQFGPGELLTIVLWISITDGNDQQYILLSSISDSTSSQQSLVEVDRVLYHSSSGALSGLMDATIASSFGGSLNAGDAHTVLPVLNSGDAIYPIGVQLSYSPNTLKLWVGRDEIVSTAPTGTANSPQVLGDLLLGAFKGTAAHVQVHVGNFTRTDFLAQAAAGGNGLDGQRTDERIATILRYAGVTGGTALDEGSTFMQRASLAGKRPGQLIDEAVDAERGRFFVDGAGVPTFHSRVRAYNL